MNSLRFPLIAALLAATISANAVSKEPPAVSVDVSADRQHAYEDRERGFSAMMRIATATESERFLHQWQNTPTEHSPGLTITETAAHGDIVSNLLFYSGCAADEPEGSECPARIDLRVIAPDGSIYGEYKNESLAQGQPTAAKVVQLSPIMMRIRFDPEDRLGTYRIQARIHDPERDIVLTLETSIELKASGQRP